MCIREAVPQAFGSVAQVDALAPIEAAEVEHVLRQLLDALLRGLVAVQ
jgi:hypothetical protein